jgi:hypothetical protein
MFSIYNAVNLFPRSTQRPTVQPREGSATAEKLAETLAPLGISMAEFYQKIKLTPQEKRALQTNLTTSFDIVEKKLGLVVHDPNLGRISAGYKQGLEGTFHFTKEYLPTIEALTPFVEAQLKAAQ